MKKIFQHPFLKSALRCGAFLAFPFAMQLLAGCVSFTIFETESPDPPGNVPSSFQTRVEESVTNDERNEIDEVVPVLIRQGGTGASLQFFLMGSIWVREETPGASSHVDEQRLAFGFFPGAAIDREVDEAMGTALQSVWFNVIFAGTPTVSGLLIEPFVHANSERCSKFSRSAIFGFHRWRATDRSEGVQTGERRLICREKFPLQGFSCAVRWSNGIGGEYATPTSRIVVDIPVGAKSLDVKLSIPQEHPLKAQLAPFETASFHITVPEE